MFETVELGRKVSKKDYAAEERQLRSDLLHTQWRLQEAGVAVIVLVSGVEGAGKGEVVSLLNEWLDTRGIQTHAFWDDTQEERERPRYWRFWRALPARGTLAILFGSWYTQPIIEHAMGALGSGDFEREMHRICEFEHLLIDDGALIVKLWFHLSRDEQQKRLKDETQGTARRRTSAMLKKFAKHYQAFRSASEHAIRMTDTGPAPWNLIEAGNRRYRDLAAGRALLVAMQRRLARPSVATLSSVESAPLQPGGGAGVLDTLDLSRSLSPASYARQLTKYQNRIFDLAWKARERKRFCVAVFEGWDAAGKGGAIRRLTQAIDARLYRVISIAAPSDEERAHHYLWRFWRHLPRAGYLTIYDRSWYGRVLVERVEDLAAEDEWLRAYQEINDFEAQLTEHGVVLLKFWLHISPEEQLRRFRERERTPWKRHKITDEDWRNRERWGLYEAAVDDMVARTSTEYAPWTLVAANDKRHARVQVLKTVHQRLARELD